MKSLTNEEKELFANLLDKQIAEIRILKGLNFDNHNDTTIVDLLKLKFKLQQEQGLI